MVSLIVFLDIFLHILIIVTRQLVVRTGSYHQIQPALCNMGNFFIINWTHKKMLIFEYTLLRLFYCRKVALPIRLHLMTALKGGLILEKATGLLTELKWQMYAVCACSHTTVGYDFIQLSSAGLGQYLDKRFTKSPLQEVVLVIQEAILNNWTSVPDVTETLVSGCATVLVP